MAMDNYSLSTYVYDDPQEMEATGSLIVPILEGLGQSIQNQIGNVQLGRLIRILIRDRQDRVVGGIVADLFGGWAYISLLWIDESLRNSGLGTRLVTMLEQEALRQGCSHAHLETYSFEARPFYEKLGYELFATLEDYPPGHRKYFLKKTLGAG
jgi:GNAT superfamily N-acetyltransferase